MDGGDDAVAARRLAQNIWVGAVAVLLGPSLLVWIVRTVGFAARCAPGPLPCRGIELGGGLRDALDLAWSLGDNALLLVSVALVAALAGLFARRPMMAAACLLLLPLVALTLPMLAVIASRYDGCQINPDGIGDCTLWGAKMGMAFHAAAQVPDRIAAFAPYSFSLALMLGVLGWFFARPRPQHATAHTYRFPDRFQ